MRTLARCQLIRTVVLTLSSLVVLSPTVLGQLIDFNNIGFPDNGAFDGDDFESVQLNNLNLHIEIPVWSTKGRGPSAWVKYVYDGNNWTYKTFCTPKGNCTDTVVPGSPYLHLTFPWNYQGRETIKINVSCDNGLASSNQYSNFTLTEPNGTTHSFVPKVISDPGNKCNLPSPSSLQSDDGSGWVVILDTSNSEAPLYYLRKDGSRIVPSSCGTWNVEDDNGNEVTDNCVLPPSPETGTDTVGRTFNTDGSYTDSGGTLRSLQVATTSLAIATNLCQYDPNGNPCSEYSGTWTVPQKITLPNGLSYTFQYTSNGLGAPQSVTLPTGGQIAWNWVGTKLSSRTITANGSSYTWTYGLNSGEPEVTDPAGNVTQYTFAVLNPPSAVSYFSQVQYYAGVISTSNLVKTVANTYQVIGNSTSGWGPILPDNFQQLIAQTTTWNQQNIASRVETDWDNLSGMSWGNVVNRREYDYGSNGTWGNLLRTTHYDYLHLQSSSPYLAPNIADRATDKIVYNGALSQGNLVAQTNYSYDQGTLTSTSGTPAPNHDYTLYGSSNTLRGNLTESTGLIKSTNAYLNTYYTYNDLGNMQTTTDPAGNQTTFSYVDSWADSHCPVGANTFAYMTKTTDPLGHRAEHWYYTCTGLQQATKDENDISNSRAGTTYTYDLMNRILVTSDPDGGQASDTYNDTTFPLSVTQSKLVTSGTSIVTMMAVDDLGRKYHTSLQDPDCHTSNGLVTVDYGYGFNSNSFTNARYTTVSNPYCQQSDPTYGVTTTNYDGIGRVTGVVRADGSTTTTSYSANVATLTDETGKQRKTQMDGLGRLTYVWEDPNNLNYETDYAYDALDDVTSIVQKGGGASGTWRTRTFTYDSLARLKCSANPEITSSVNSPATCPTTDNGTYTPGTIYYIYDSDSNLQNKTAPAPNQTGTSSTVVTAYTYDKVNRLTGKYYNGGYNTTTVQYAYDGNSLSCTPAVPPITPADSNPVGHRTAMCDASGAIAWSHDPMGRELRAKQTLVGSSNVTQVFAYTYNLDGSLATLQYPSGRTITYSTSAAGRTTSVKDVANSLNYLTGATYAPPGGIASFANYGTINGAFSYNSRLQPLQIFYGTNSPPSLTGSTCPSTVGNIMHRVYHFGLGSNDNGNVQEIDNCKDSNRTVFYTFDSLNRIESASTQGTNGCNPLAACWGQLFGQMVNGSYVAGYDGWSNLFQVTATKGMPTTLNQTVTTHNQFAGMTYDAAGNLTNDGQGDTYIYDDENRLLAASGWTYTYDGDGRRTIKCNSCSSSSGGSLYWYGAGETALVESNLAGTLTNEYILFNGRRLARRNNTVPAAPTFYFSDHLGSTSVTAGSAGTIKNESDFYPFGGEAMISDSLPQNYKFTGKERDSESGLDNFDSRYYSSSLGRFMKPDDPLLYWDRDNPQSLNLYGYALNNPTSNTDDGHDCVYLNNAGNGVESVDQSSSSGECGNTGGYWVNGGVTNAQIDENSVTLTGTTNGVDNNTSASYLTNGDVPISQSASQTLSLAGQLAAPGVNFAAKGLEVFGWMYSAPAMLLATCASGGPGCNGPSIAMAILPEVSALREGTVLLKEGAAFGKGAEILQKAGGVAQATKDFEALQGTEAVYGGARVKTLADGSKAVLYQSTGGSGATTIAIQNAAGRTVTKIRY